MNRVYQLEKFKIKVNLAPKLIRVFSDAELWYYMEEKNPARFNMLIQIIKDDYESYFGKPLMITNDSLLVEIVVHVYCDYIGLKFNRLVKIKWVQRMVGKLLKRAEIVDCGERGVDTNRWLWDYLSQYKNLILKMLPNRLNSSHLKPH